MPKPSGIHNLRSFLVTVAWTLPKEDDDVQWMAEQIMAKPELVSFALGREILTLRFGLDGNGVFSYKEISDKLKIAADEVRTTERKAIALAKSLRKRGKHD